jgi:hypothetical protein
MVKRQREREREIIHMFHPMDKDMRLLSVTSDTEVFNVPKSVFNTEIS